uniref:Gelsolin-like domain-containing protein n=1 Tax=Prasinoderma singulare TaxID=676789 RepID=A0A7S3C1Y5_9VIRI|mmetsp:Transcript_6494/g.19521  ORF Transcript_6494/g.19521 Transcript_6494/m.19521 type:complete len:364 (+) Transcript_6494:143-1234(+)
MPAEAATGSASAGSGDPDPQLEGAGAVAGLRVWRVENRRGDGAGAAAKFGVAAWPTSQYGDFYRGDAYLVLKSTQLPHGGGLAHDVHFWLGSQCTKDEATVAAYKAVELDTLLSGAPVQHRETEGKESPQFQSYFRSLRYMNGGIDSGFSHVTPDEYEARLYQVRKTKHTTRAFQCPMEASSLHHGDAFVLDAGREVYAWFGDECSPFERARAANLQAEIVDGRMGKARKGDADDDAFWEALGGSATDVRAAVHDKVEADEIDATKCDLYRLSDATGELAFTHVEAGGQVLDEKMLDTDDVFIIDAQVATVVWIGAGSSDEEKANAMRTAMTFLERHGRPLHTPVNVIKQGQSSDLFRSIFKK